jgi:hypothetical protein
MTDENHYVDHGNAGLQPMVLYRQGKTEYNVMAGRGMYMYSSTPGTVKVRVGSYANNACEINIEIDPETITPHDAGLTLIDKVRMRFNMAAKNGTDVDLRFCTGEPVSRNPEHDNLRPGYGGMRVG